MRATLVLAALTIGFYWKLTLTRDFTFLNAPDLANQVLPWYQFQTRAWHSGIVPLWDPHQWCGQALLGQLQPGATFPLNWPLFWAPLKNGKLSLDLFHWHFVLMHWLAALFMYAYCRELERTRPASVLAAAGFSLSGFVGTTTWPQMMNGALWTPLVFLLYRRAVRSPTRLATAANATGCGAALGAALLAGHHQVPLFVALALGGVFLYDLASKLRRRRLLLIFSGIALVAALSGALALVPAWEYGSRAYRWLNIPSPLRMDQTVPYTAHQGLGIIPLSLMGVVFPEDETTANPFIGLVPVTLALLGVAASWRLAAVRLHAALALGGLAYSLGVHSIFQGALYAALPLLDKARSPGHAILLFHFGLLVAAAHGADALDGRTSWQPRLTKGLLAAAGLLWAGLLLLSAQGTFMGARSQSLMLVSIVALLLAGILGARLAPRSRCGGLVLLLLAETSAATSYLIQPRTNSSAPTYLDRYTQHPEIVDFLRRQPRPFRFHADENEIPFNLADWEGMDSTAGYLASVSADLFDFVSLEWTRSALYLNQVYFVGRQQSRPEQVEVFADAAGLKVFRNPDALPRAWLVHEAQTVPDRAAAAALMGSDRFDPARSVFLFGPAPALESCEGGQVEITTLEVQRVTAQASSPCRAMAVFSDPVFPGWRAQVDGMPAPIYPAYGALRGIVFPAGNHTVELIYRPWSVYAGGAVTATGLAGGLLLWLAAWRRSRKAADRASP